MFFFGLVPPFLKVDFFGLAELRLRVPPFSGGGLSVRGEGLGGTELLEEDDGLSASFTRPAKALAMEPNEEMGEDGLDTFGAAAIDDGSCSIDDGSGSNLPLLLEVDAQYSDTEPAS